MTRKRVQKHFTQPTMTEQHHAHALHTPNLIRRYVQSGEPIDNANALFGEQLTHAQLYESQLKIASWNSAFEELPKEEREKYESPQEWVSQKLYEASQGDIATQEGGTSGESTPSADGDVSPPEESLDDS